jgi:cold-inducible RNA-binding protein
LGGFEINILHVSGLPRKMKDEDLGRLFTPFGTVLHARLIRNFDGDSIGFGIVEMSSPYEVEEILNTLDRITVGGKRPNIWKPSASPQLTS